MTNLMNELKKIASDSTVKTVAGTLAAGGFLLNVVFDFGQTTLDLAFQGLTAAAVLGLTVVNAAKKQPQKKSSVQEAPQCCQPDNPYDHQEDKTKKTLIPSLLSSFFTATTSCGSVAKMQHEDKSENSPLHQTCITYFFNEVPNNVTSCGFSNISSKKKRRNANNDMIDMAYGIDTRAGWTPWANR